MKIYFLKLKSYLDDERHYENLYATKEKAICEGKSRLESLLREQYEEWFEDDEKDQIPKLTKEQLFKLKAVYDFSITECEVEELARLEDHNNLPIMKDYDEYAKLTPAKIIYHYDYNGNETDISGVFIFNFKGKRKEIDITMSSEDYRNPLSGTKLKKGDIVKVKNNPNASFRDKLYVVTDVPQKGQNQKFFMNCYEVIVNHNEYDEGCHRDIFQEQNLERYTQELPNDSPVVFLSKYFKGEIELKEIQWSDIECGKITLNESKSFRDFPQIMKQLKGEKNERNR